MRSAFPPLALRFTAVNPWTKPADTYGTGGIMQTRSVAQTDQGVIADTYALNPTTVLDVNLPVLRNYSVRTAWKMGLDLTKEIGWPAGAVAQLVRRELPQTQVTGYSQGGNRTVALFLQQISNSEAINGGVTKTIGRHTLAFWRRVEA